MAEKTYVIEGNPIPLARARYNRNTMHLYDSQRKERIHAELLVQFLHGSLPLFAGPLSFEVSFYLPISKAFLRKQKDACENKWHHKKPDSSNLLKWAEDICNKITYYDDAQICRTVIEKRYSRNPRTEFTIRELDDGN